MPGKVPPDLLTEIVFKRLGVVDPNVLMGPELGQDASVLRVGDRVIIVSTDPITGSIEDVGWLAVHINANDIATFGVPPCWFLATIMLPPGATANELSRIMSQIDDAARSLNIAVVGGHTEITEAISHPIVVGVMMGMTDEHGYVTSSGARVGDAIVLTKSIALEGTAILATECSDYLSERLSPDTITTARALREHISVVRDGITAFGTGHVTAMHDPTEGGLFGGIHELCDASGVGCEIDLDAIPIHPATRAVCDALNVDIYSLISSGTMLFTCASDYAESVITALRDAGIDATVIGRTVSDSATRLILHNSQSSPMPRPKTDALWDGLRCGEK